MIDTSWIGTTLPTAHLRVERGRLEFFARATGARETVSSTAPLTFLFSAYADNDIYFNLLDRLGVDPGRLLHAEQSFEYLVPVAAGDELRVEGRLADIYTKKNGALEFLKVEAEAFNQEEAKVARLESLLVIRNGPGA